MTVADSARSSLQMWVRALELTAPIERTPSRTLPVVIEELGERLGPKRALVSSTSELSYRALAEACNRVARWGLARGLSRGDVVGLLLENCPDYLALWLGLTRIGVVVALINTHLSGTTLAHAINVVAPRYVIFGARFAIAMRTVRGLIPSNVQCWSYGVGDEESPRLDLTPDDGSGERLTPSELRACSLEDCALYIYTSGTTGLPKAARVSHFRLMQWSHWFAGMMGVTAADRMYDCLPFYHSVGGVVATGATLVGEGCVVVRERFSAHQFWSDILSTDCTLFQYIGELCRYLLQSPPSAQETQHRLRLCCGNGLSGEIWGAFRHRFRIPNVLEYYAATEGSFSLYNCEQRPGAIGRIPPFLPQRTSVALVQLDLDSTQPRRDETGYCIRCQSNEIGEAIGRLAAASGQDSGRFEGYADDEATRAKVLRDVFTSGDAWYRTGDLMRQDGQGFFFFVDRVGDTFRWKGENVSTTEVAATIMRCPDVLDAAVYGVVIPNADGRAGMAALVVDPTFDLARLREQLIDSLPDYARPLIIRIVGAIELTATFKLKKHELARQGYDPALTRDELYLDDRRLGRYVPLDTMLHARLLAGELRL